MAAPPKPVRRLTLIGNHPVTTATTMLDLYEPLDVIGSGSFGIIVSISRTGPCIHCLYSIHSALSSENLMELYV